MPPDIGSLNTHSLRQASEVNPLSNSKNNLEQTKHPPTQSAGVTLEHSGRNLNHTPKLVHKGHSSSDEKQMKDKNQPPAENSSLNNEALKNQENTLREMLKQEENRAKEMTDTLRHMQDEHKKTMEKYFNLNKKL